MRDWILTVRGLPLRVWELNEGEGAPVLCLHGWLDQGLAFARVAAGQPGRWVALDQRGHGGSGHLSGGAYYHFPDYLGDLDALVEALGGRVRLIGHSMGGTVASMYAGARPEAVERLVIIEGLGALPISEGSMLVRTRQFLSGLRSPPGAMRLESLEEAAARLLRRHEGLSEPHARLLAEHGTRVDGEGRCWSFDPMHLTRAPYPFREDAYLEFLGAITAPTLILWGEESWYPLEIQARRSAAVAGALTATLPGGHMLPYSAPEALRDHIAPFLAL